MRSIRVFSPRIWTEGADEEGDQQADQESRNQTVETKSGDPPGENTVGIQVVPTKDGHQSGNHAGDHAIAAGP